MKNRIKMKKTIAAFVFVCTLAVAFVISGTTLAWLTDKTELVKNTFTTSDIDITLTETKGTLNGENHEFKMIPGYTIEKDPVVTVKANSEKCYVFVKLEKSVNFDHFMTYTMAGEWIVLDGVESVFYRVVEAGAMDQKFDVLEENKVQVKATVTKEMMNALSTDTYPTLTITAYASQYMKNNDYSFTAAEAWENVPKS